MKADTRVDVKKTDVPEIVCESDLYYNVDDIPPVGTTLFYGFQLAVSNVCYFILLSLTIQDFICADRNFATTMFSTMSFMAGVSTIIQTYFGVRLPVFQGPSVIWFLAYGNVKNDPKWGCNLNNTAMASTSVNGTDITAEDNAPGWEAEWAKVAGALMVTQCVQMLLGATGLIALLGRIIRPITIAVFFILISLYLHEIIANFCRENWWISSASILVVLILAQYIHWIKIPMPTWTPKKGCTVTKMPVFELFSMLLAVLILWALTAILTAAGVFTDNKDDIGYQVRTDIHSKAIDDAPVFIWPQPGQFVREIDFDVGYFAILLVPVFATIIESMGDYSQFAMSCCMPRPPAHAVNRGIFIEGLCGFFCALLGMGMATMSYSHIAGFFRVTKVGSRLVYLVAGIMLIILAVFGKVGAVFVSIPKPVLAGPIFIGTALLVGATFMNLSYVDLAKSRSQTILGCSIMIGVLVPFYIVRSPIKTGSDIADRLLTSVISPHYLLGAFIAAILDNTLPGRADAVIQSVVTAQQGADATTPLEANGMIELGAIDAGKQDKPQRTYDGLMKGYDPPFISKYTRRWKCSRFVPMLPNPYSEDKQGTGPTFTNL